MQRRRGSIPCQRTRVKLHEVNDRRGMTEELFLAKYDEGSLGMMMMKGKFA